MLAEQLILSSILDPYLTSQYVTNFVKGMQEGSDDSRYSCMYVLLSDNSLMLYIIDT